MKHILTTTLAILLAIITTTAHDFEVDGIYYRIINGNEVAVTCKGANSYEFNNEYTGNVIIPTTVTYGGTTYTVTSIGSSAFYGCSSLNSVDIPNSIIRIENGAFRNSSLTSINIPNSVTAINQSTFQTQSFILIITLSRTVLHSPA